MLTVPPTAHVLPLKSVPLVLHPALCLVPRQLRDDLGVQEPDLDVHQQPETQISLSCSCKHKHRVDLQFNRNINQI